MLSCYHLDFWPLSLKINKAQALIMMDHCAKFDKVWVKNSRSNVPILEQTDVEMDGQTEGCKMCHYIAVTKLLQRDNETNFLLICACQPWQMTMFSLAKTIFDRFGKLASVRL